MSRVGFFGGTFDPVHHGHLIVAQDVLCELSLDVVYFIPASVPPHKTHRKTSPERHRLAMIELAIQGNPSFASSDIEIRRGGVSYTVDTVDTFRREYGSDAELFFLLGSDNLADIETWRTPGKLVELCTLVAMKRPGYESPVIPDWLEGHTVDVDVTSVDISAHAIRERVKRGIPVHYLVPPAVVEYIERENLYRGGSSA